MKAQRANHRSPLSTVSADVERAGYARQRSRRGTTMVETAIVLMVFLTLTFGMLDLGLTVLHEHIVNHAARQAARLAIVHGTMAPPKLTTWGPTTTSFAGTDTGEVGTAISPYLAGLDLSTTTVTLEWLDGNSQPGSRVRATVVTTHSPMTNIVFSSDWTLTGKSTLPIAH